MADQAPLPVIGGLLRDSLQYWERRRPLYNAALAAIVLVHFFAAWPGSKQFLHANSLLGLFLLVVLANVAYCAVYVVDVFVQLAGSRDVWARRRWILFVIGVAFAGVLAHFLSSGMFS